MPVTVPELLSDLPEGLALYNAISEAIKGLPPVGQRTAVSWAKAFGASDGSPLALTAALIDKIEGQAAS